MTDHRDLLARLRKDADDLERYWKEGYALNTDDVAASVREAAQVIEALLAALNVCEQALLEVEAAQSRGAEWYTRGASGLYQQVAMWVQKGRGAIRSAITPQEASPHP